MGTWHEADLWQTSWKQCRLGHQGLDAASEELKAQVKVLWAVTLVTEKAHGRIPWVAKDAFLRVSN